jgi:hypothetical protein
MLTAVAAINKQIQELAPVLNSPTVSGRLTIDSSDSEVPVEAIVKHHGGETFVFAVSLRGRGTTATFKLADVAANTQADVVGENRRLELQGDQFRDSFEPWDVHLYRLSKPQ